MVLAFVMFSEFTRAWLLYLGLIFMFMVMYAPGGIASLIMMNVRVAMFGKLRRLWPSYLALGAAFLVLIVGAAALVEMIYHLQLGSAMDSHLSYLGLQLDSSRVDNWLAAVAVAVIGFAAFELTRRRFAVAWGVVQTEIEAEIKRRQGQ